MEQLQNLWRWISDRRHRSEAFALQLARRLSVFAFVPILVMVFFWWLLFFAPLAILFTAVSGLLGITSGGASILGLVVYDGLRNLALTGLIVALPWLFQWYGIALTLSFGRGGMADRKEEDLRARIAAYEDGGRG